MISVIMRKKNGLLSFSHDSRAVFLYFLYFYEKYFLKNALLDMRPYSHRGDHRQGMSLLESPHKKINQRRL